MSYGTVVVINYGLEEDISFKIYNRWNKIVYECSSLTELKTFGWDGKFNEKDQPDGVYIWTLSSSDLNGFQNPLHELRTGSVLLNR